MGKDLSAQFRRLLTEYQLDVEQAINKQGRAVAKKALKRLRDESPEDTGDYKKGWSLRETKPRGRIRFEIYNKTDYQLTHLLEYGHAKVNGGRVEAKEHIKPVERQAVKEFLDAIEEAVRE